MIAAAAVATASGADADTANCIESAWSKLKGPLLDTATEVCGLSKNHPQKADKLSLYLFLSARTTSGNQKPGGGMKRWAKL